MVLGVSGAVRWRRVAPVVAFPCRDGCAGIGGANIPVDGGMFARLLIASPGAPWADRGNRGRSR